MNRLDIGLRAVGTAASLVVLGLGVETLATAPVSPWATASLLLFLVLLAVTTPFIAGRPANFFGLVAALFSTLVLGRLFSTMRLGGPSEAELGSIDPLLVAETGPGIPALTWSTTALVLLIAVQMLLIAWRHQTLGVDRGLPGPARQATYNEWVITFIRLYVGLMYVAHFAGHLFAGPPAFGVFVAYFGSLGLPFPEGWVILAGVIELAAAIGVAFGFMTRIAAVCSVIYLFVSVGLGGHYGVGYVWVLPTGGWEFPALWMFVTAMMAAAGGGAISIDALLRERARTLPGVLRAAVA
ncbi:MULTISPECIES: DoxX family protein [Rhodoplanes]|uniref:DoxX family protein n=1 Tax=Rhodoplanes TaxID=29407 RepID=UPI001A90F5DA|nr:DoxX family protein [Rhodoplanes serenus]